LLPVYGAIADDPNRCVNLFLCGKYDECSSLAREAIGQGQRDEAWWLWGTRADLIRGRHEEARELLDGGLTKNSYAVRLRLLAYDLYRQSGDRKRADRLLREIHQLADRASWRYTDPADRVALGRAALLLGADPRQVLELSYDRVRKEKQPPRDVFLASGELALEKHDDEVAAQLFSEGLKHFPDDPDILFGLARSYANSDPKRTKEYVEAALKGNAVHVPSLLFLADHAIDSEQYDEALIVLGRILEIDPWQPDAWGYRAVLAHLAGDSAGETAHRINALKYSAANPAVDYLIGRKLSQKYRFSEGAAYQRKALDLDADYLPAKIQLAQDLLRLGDEDGWRLASSVQDRDRYDITAFNLVTLRENIENYRLLTDGKIMVRMEPREADLYGDDVVRLLRRASDTLCQKYGLELTEPVTVEIFPQQSDFAVRTFGLPGGAGYLGVCFGKLVTVNSPASQGETPTSWESVLWHEFCHVVTLQLTRNKMPRWLSEGISVFEECQADPAWGQGMTPEYRDMILNDQLTPVSKLSGAFLAPPSGRHLQFAYFQSSLVVRFMAEQFGHDAIRAVLADLSRDVPINQSLESHSKMTMDDFERKFEEFARRQAEALAPQTSFDRDSLPKPSGTDVEKTATWLKENGNNFWGTLQLASLLIRDRKFADAIEPLERAIALYPGHTGADNPYVLLATAYRELGRPDDERRVLSRLAVLDADAAPALLRLLELQEAAGDSSAIEATARRLLGANPLLAQPHRALARATEQLGKSSDAISAYRKVLLLDPEDPADLHYRLARLLHAQRDQTAKRHVLMALEEAPRFPEALRLLLEIERADQN
jgi:tetratricopeptide (TPR) repeat protein